MAYAMDTTAGWNDLDWAGRVVDGRYTLLESLGGSEGNRVFLTELQGDGSRKAAIKLIPDDGGERESRIAGWQATKALTHPNLLRLLDSGRCEIGGVRLLYVVTEYAEEVLSQVLAERALTANETREMLEPVLDALSYIHGKGYVHGQLKPSNILVVNDRLKLSADRVVAAGSPGNYFGGLGVHDPPEADTMPISFATDAWSLGITLIEALTQHPPAWDRFDDRDPAVPEMIPQPFAAIARECLLRDPAHRCRVSDVRARLAGVQPSEKVAASVVPELAPTRREPIFEPEPAPAKRRGALLAGAALVVIAAVAVMLVRSHREAAPGEPAAAGGDQAAPASVTTSKPSPAGDQAAPASLASPKPAPDQDQAAPASVAAPNTPPDHQQPPADQQPFTTGGDATARGAVAERVMPDALPSALATISGQVTVRVRVAVDANGTVSDATFDSAGPSKYFSRVALQAAQRWKFRPAEIDGRAVPSEWMLRFSFRQTGAEAEPVETKP